MQYQYFKPEFKHIVDIESAANNWMQVDWCKQYIGAHLGSWACRRSHQDNWPVAYRYYFRNESDAIMFKLKFG